METVNWHLHPYNTAFFDIVKRVVGRKNVSVVSSDCNRDRKSELQEWCRNCSRVSLKYFYGDLCLNRDEQRSRGLEQHFVTDEPSPWTYAIIRNAGLWYVEPAVVELLPVDYFRIGSTGLCNEGVSVRHTRTSDLDRETWQRLKACVAYSVVALEGRLSESPLSLRTARRILCESDAMEINYTDRKDHFLELCRTTDF